MRPVRSRAVRPLTLFLMSTAVLIWAHSAASAAQYADTFDGNQIALQSWGEVGGIHGISVTQNDALIISGTSSTSSPWSAGAVARYGTLFPAEGLEVSVDMAATGTDYWSGLWLKDGDNSIHLFTGRYLAPVGCTYYINGQGVYNIRLSDRTGTRYGMRYSGGVMHMLVDGHEVGSQSIPMSTVQITLSAAVKGYGDTVDARFDNFTVTSVPEPSGVLTGIIGLYSLLSGFSVNRTVSSARRKGGMGGTTR